MGIGVSTGDYRASGETAPRHVLQKWGLQGVVVFCSFPGCHFLLAEAREVLMMVLASSWSEQVMM